MDPFAVLGLEPRMDLLDADLEKVYLRLSRETHPDAHPGASAKEQVAILSRSADINDAYKKLRDPWQRARAILELRVPGIMEQTKDLQPTFLMEAMEQAEEVAKAGEDDKPGLARRLDRAIAESLAQISVDIENDRNEAAAVLLHESRYHRKARADLDGSEPEL